MNTWVNTADAAWATGSLTWNNQPDFTAYTTGATTEGDWHSFNVADKVQDWVNAPSTNFGFVITESTLATYWKRLISSEDPSDKGPKLQVTYTVPTVTAVLSDREYPDQ